MGSKQRAKSSENDSGELRHKLFKIGFARINDAIEHHYYLEAICLIESLLADRMESRAADHKEDYRGFDCLGAILRKLDGEENPKLCKLNTKVNQWRCNRNEIHEVMKIDVNDATSWTARSAKARATAIAGRKLLRDYDQALREARRTS